MSLDGEYMLMTKVVSPSPVVKPSHPTQRTSYNPTAADSRPAKSEFHMIPSEVSCEVQYLQFVMMIYCVTSRSCEIKVRCGSSSSNITSS